MDTPRMPGGVLRLEPTSTAAADQFVTGSARVHLFNASVTVELRTTSGNVLQLVTVCITIDEFFNLKYDGFQH